MTDMKRSSISFPDDVVRKIEAVRNLPENRGKPFSKVAIQLIRDGLAINSAEPAAPTSSPPRPTV